MKNPIKKVIEEEDIRPGNRGGKDQFSWDQIKGAKESQVYLGNSVKIPYNRFHNGKDFLWYEKHDSASEDLRKEKEEIRKKEMEMMRKALGK